MKALKSRSQNGAALFVALILLAVLMVLGVVSVRNSVFQEKMASNLHQLNWAQNASNAGVGAFTVMANEVSSVTPASILFQARVNGKQEVCIDQNGNQTAADIVNGEKVCTTTYLDGVNQTTNVKLEVEKHGCVPQFCFGTSLGGGENRIQCLAYIAKSHSNAAGALDTVEFWGFEYSMSCD